MKRRLALVLVASTFTLAVCQQDNDGKPGVPTTAGSVRLYLTDFLLRAGCEGRDVPINLKTPQQPEGIPISSGVPFRFNHAVCFSVYQETSLGPRNYRAIVSPHDDPNALVEATLRTSDARVYIGAGWVLLLGTLPVTETEWGTSTAEGTAFAVYIKPANGATKAKQFVYNLERGGGSVVDFSLPGSNAKTPVPPGKYLVCVKGEPVDPAKDTDPNDPIVQKMRARAHAVGIEVP